MQGLLYGVRPEEWTPPDDSNHLLVGLSRTPMRLQELSEPKPIRDDWAVAKTRLTGICGSDAKMVFMDFGDDFGDSALNGYFSFPTVFGHEVVADVVEVGPAVTTLEVGQRVVLNPWLSCAPRGIDPMCPSCQAGDYSLCYHFTEGPIAAGIHTGTSKDAPGGFADYFPAHESMLIPVPENLSDEQAVIGDPFAVSLHSVTRHPPTAGGKVLIYGGGALGSCATAIIRALWPDVEVMVVAAWPAQKALAEKLGATVVDPFPVEQLLEEAASWSGGVLQKFGGSALADGASGWLRRRLRHRGDRADRGDRRPAAQAARHHGQERRARAGALGMVAAVLQGDLLGRLERLRGRGGGRRTHARHRPLPEAGLRGSGRHDRDAHPHLPPRRVAGGVHRPRHPEGERRYQGRVRLSLSPRAAQELASCAATTTPHSRRRDIVRGTLP